MHRMNMLQLSLNHLQFPGQWKNFILSYNQAISLLRLTKSLLKQFCQRLLTKEHPYCRDVWLWHSLIILQYNIIPGLSNQLADCLPIGGQKDTIKLPNFMLTALWTSCVLEATVWIRLGLLPRMMMSLPCSSIPLLKVGQAL